MSIKKFGLDLDNTLIDYSQPTKEYCKFNGLRVHETLKDLRNYIKYENDNDEDWQTAQAWIYTEGLNYASLTEGTNDFLRCLRENGFEVSIISHKTSHTQKKHGSKELHSRTLEWLSSRIDSKHFELRRNIYFEPTKDFKIKRIQSLDINYFVDDLIEILKDKNFPSLTKKYLFSSEKLYNLPRDIQCVSDFNSIACNLNLQL